MEDEKLSALKGFLNRLTRRSVLDEAEQAAILELPAQRTEVSAHRDFVRMDEDVEHACLVASGLTGRFAQTAAGDRQFIAVHIPGDMVDLHSVVAPRVTTPLHALVNSVVWKIPHVALRTAATRYPALAHAFWRDGIIDANIIAQAVLNLGRRPARARVAHLLCEMATRFETIGGGGRDGFDFPVTQIQLADMLGLTSVHVNRMLRLLREEGLAEMAGGQVRILDWPGLVNAGDFDPTYLQLHAIDFHLNAGAPG